MTPDGELNLEWQAPRGETAAALERTQNQLDRLQNQLDRLQKDFDSVRGALFCAVLPRTDKLAIRCLLDVFLAKEGYSPQSCGPRRAWVTANKATISQVTGIPEGNVDRLFQAYQDEGDESAHTFTADAIAYGVMRVTNAFDRDDLRAVYSAALSLTVEDELHGRNPYITTLRGGILGPGELRITNEPKPVPS